MIARSVVCCADACESEGIYRVAYKKANAEEPRASCKEQLATTLALSVFGAFCGAYYESLMSSEATPRAVCLEACEISACLIPTSALLHFICSSEVERDDSSVFSTGCLRDCKVLLQTFSTAKAETSHLKKS